MKGAAEINNYSFALRAVLLSPCRIGYSSKKSAAGRFFAPHVFMGFRIPLRQVEVDLFLAGSRNFKHDAVPTLLKNDIGITVITGKNVDRDLLQMPRRENTHRMMLFIDDHFPIQGRS